MGYINIRRDAKNLVKMAERVCLIENLSPAKKVRVSTGFRGLVKFAVFLAVGG